MVGGLAGYLMHEQGRNFAGPSWKCKCMYSWGGRILIWWKQRLFCVCGEVMTSVPYWDLNGLLSLSYGVQISAANPKVHAVHDA